MNAKSEHRKTEFSKRLTAILSHGALNLAMAIGYRSRLFDVMDEFESPQTASAIAAEGGLDERYVKEWLGVVVSGKIVEFSRSSSGEDLFHLPKEHGDLITRRAGNSNLGVYMQEIPLLTTCALAPVLRGFSTGEGVTYDHYRKFYEFVGQPAEGKNRSRCINRRKIELTCSGKSPLPLFSKEG
jgi:hypothetical protein